MRTIVLQGLPDNEVYVNDVDPNNQLITVRKGTTLVGFIAVKEPNGTQLKPLYYISRGTKATAGIPVLYDSIRSLIEALKYDYSFHINE